MIQAKCIQKFRDDKGKIYGYRLVDLNGQTQDVTPDNLKRAIHNKQINVVNLTLTKTLVEAMNIHYLPAYKSLKEDVKYSETIILNEELDRPAIEISVYEAISYEKVLKDLREVEFTGLKKLILNEIFVNEMSIKDFCSKYNVNSKDVYNHIYIIRSKLKQRFNDY